MGERKESRGATSWENTGDKTRYTTLEFGHNKL